MAVESATYVGQLNSTYPAGAEPIAQGDDHLRLIKTTLLNTFPSMNGPIANYAVMKTGDHTMAGKLTAAGYLTSIAQGTEINALTRKDYVDGALALKAPLASPAFTGTPTAPTATAGTNTTQLATTAFVAAAAALKVSKAGDTMTGQLKGITPVAADDLARKDYVDTKVAKSGDTMTGFLNINPPYAGGTYYLMQCVQGAVNNLSGIYSADGRMGFILRGEQGINDINSQIFDSGSNAFALMLKSAGSPLKFTMFASIVGTTNDFCIQSGDLTYSYRLQPAGAGWTTLSTRASKDNIRPVESSLDKINSLEPVRFNYKNSPDVESIGFIAEDICQVDPILASYDLDGTPTGVGKDNIVPFLVKAVQELSAKVAALEARLP